MNGSTRKLALNFPATLALLATLALGTIVAPAVAEVGVHLSEVPQNTSLQSAYILQIIVDDGDPTSSVWRRYRSDSTSLVVLNDTGETNGDGLPSLVCDAATGTVWVAWARNSQQGFDVVVSRFENGTWTAPEVVAGSPDDERDPVLVIDAASATLHLVYGVGGAAPHVAHRTATLPAGVWSAAEVVSAPGEIAARPHAVVHGGTLRVIYESHSGTLGGTPRQIVLARADAPGFTSQVLAGSTYAGELWPRIHVSAARLWVDWFDDVATTSWLRDEGTAWSPISDEPHAGFEDREFFVRGRVRTQVLLP